MPPVKGKDCASGQGRVARARRQVDNHIVQATPFDISEELPNCAVQHRAPHDHRFVRRRQKAGADEFDAIDFQRLHLVVFNFGAAAAKAKHLGDIGIENISINQADSGASFGQAHRQIGGDCALAYTALAAGDRHNAVHRHIEPPVDAPVNRDLRIPMDADAVYPGDLADQRVLTALDENILQRTSRRRQHDSEFGKAIGNLQIAHHVERDNIAVELRLNDRAQRRHYRFVNLRHAQPRLPLVKHPNYNTVPASREGKWQRIISKSPFLGVESV